MQQFTLHECTLTQHLKLGIIDVRRVSAASEGLGIPLAWIQHYAIKVLEAMMPQTR